MRNELFHVSRERGLKLRNFCTSIGFEWGWEGVLYFCRLDILVNSYLCTNLSTQRFKLGLGLSECVCERERERVSSKITSTILQKGRYERVQMHISPSQRLKVGQG